MQEDKNDCDEDDELRIGGSVSGAPLQGRRIKRLEKITKPVLGVSSKPNPKFNFKREKK